MEPIVELKNRIARMTEQEFDLFIRLAQSLLTEGDDQYPPPT